MVFCSCSVVVCRGSHPGPACCYDLTGLHVNVAHADNVIAKDLYIIYRVSVIFCCLGIDRIDIRFVQLVIPESDLRSICLGKHADLGNFFSVLLRKLCPACSIDAAGLCVDIYIIPGVACVNVNIAHPVSVIDVCLNCNGVNVAVLQSDKLKCDRHCFIRSDLGCFFAVTVRVLLSLNASAGCNDITGHCIDINEVPDAVAVEICKIDQLIPIRIDSHLERLCCLCIYSGKLQSDRLSLCLCDLRLQCCQTL